MLRLTCVVENKAARPALRAEHGLAVLVEAAGGRVLWDTGGSADVFLHNWKALGLEGTPLSAAALSHAHLDHTGGLAALLKAYPGLPLYAHADIARPRFSLRDGIYAQGLILQTEALAAAADLHLSAEAQEILPGVRTTGTVAPRPHPTGGAPHLRAMDDAGRLIADPYADDMSLILEGSDGAVLLCGCCHAGLRNTIGRLRALTSAPLRAVAGGTHLHEAPRPELDAIVDLLEAAGRPAIYLNHCSGDKTLAYLASVYEGQVAAFHGGDVLEL